MDTMPLAEVAADSADGPAPSGPWWARSWLLVLALSGVAVVIVTVAMVLLGGSAGAAGDCGGG